MNEKELQGKMQAVFDCAIRGIVKQGRKSVKNAAHLAVCTYRGQDGCKCAIGWNIPDCEYQPCLEGRSVRYLADAKYPENPHAIAWARDNDRALNFLEDLQRAHDVPEDGPGYIRDFIGQATVVARRYDLAMPEVSP